MSGVPSCVRSRPRARCSPSIGSPYRDMGARWPIGDPTGGRGDDADFWSASVRAAAACPAPTAPSPKWKTARSRVRLRHRPACRVPTESDLAFARTAASDVLTRGRQGFQPALGKPRNRRAGSVTPLAQAYSSDDGRTCRDFLASYVNWAFGKLAAGRRLQGRAMAGGKFIR